MAEGGERVRPADEAQVLDAVRWAAAEEEPLELVGAGTKRGLGRPVQARRTLDLSALSGVTLYEPEELVLTARAGTPLAAIEELVASRRQRLAFEPPDLGPLYGLEAGRQTIGGVVAANLSGPRRIKDGAARDHVLGCRAVSGRAEAFKAGGRVVKNVTGYDLPKLLTGSHGTLAVLTEVTLKVLPASEEERTVLVRALGDADAVRALSDALGSPFEVSGAAHLPEPAAAAAGVKGGASATAVRVEGFGPSVAYRADRLRDLLRGRGAVEELAGEESRALWRAVRDVRPLWAPAERCVWKVSVAPADGPRLAEAVTAALPAEAFYDWGGGLVWLAVDPGAAADGGASAVRGAVAALGGHATLVRGPAALRAAVEPFQPQPPALAALSARVKAAFDPRRILNPGRMHAG